MPFQSEAQRRYLWANEPEIARDWTDTYGSRVQKNNGGIMDIASDGEVIDRFKNYKKGNQVTVPTSFQARSHSTPVKLAYITDDEAGILQSLKSGVPHDGPMHIPNYNDYDPDRGFTSGAAMSAAESGKHTSDTLASNLSNQDIQNIRSGAIAAGAGQTVNPGFFEPRHRPEISKQDLRSAKAFAPEAYRATRGSPFGIGNLFRGAMSMFGGWPGRIGSMLSHIDPRQLRGKNLDGSWRTQREWEEARNLRRDEKRMAYLSDRRKRGLDFGDQAYADLLAGKGYSGQAIEDPFQSAIDADYESGMNINEGPFTSNYLQNLDLSKYDPARIDTYDFEDVDFDNIAMQNYLQDQSNFNNQGIRSIDTIAKPSPWWKWLPKM